MDEAGTARSKLSSKVLSAFSCFGGNQSAKRFQTNSAHEPNDTDDCACKSGRPVLLPTPAIVAEGGVGGRAEPLECSSYSSAGQVSIGSTVAAPSHSCEVVMSMQGDEDMADSQSERHVEHNCEKCSDSNQDLPYKHTPGAAHGKAPTRPLLLPATRARHVPGGPICPRMMLLLLPDHLKGKAVPAGSTPRTNHHPRARPAALSAMPMDMPPMLLDHSILTPADQVADRPDIDSGNLLGAMSIEAQGTALYTGKVSQRHVVTFSEGFEDPCQPAYRAPSVSTSVNISVNTSVNTERELGDKACSGRDDSAALHTHHVSLGHTPNQHVSEDMLRGVASWDRAAVMARSLDWPSTAAPSSDMMSQAASHAGRHSAGSNIYQLRQHFPKAQAMSGLERWAQLLQLLTAGRTLEQAMEDNRRCLARYSKASVRRPVKPWGP